MQIFLCSGLTQMTAGDADTVYLVRFSPRVRAAGYERGTALSRLAAGLVA